MYVHCILYAYIVCPFLLISYHHNQEDCYVGYLKYLQRSVYHYIKYEGAIAYSRVFFLR